MVGLEVEKSHGEGMELKLWGYMSCQGGSSPPSNHSTHKLGVEVSGPILGLRASHGASFGMQNQGLSSCSQHLMLAEGSVDRWGAGQGVCCSPGLICPQMRGPH